MLQGLPTVNEPEEEAHLERMVHEIMEAVLNEPADTLWRQVFNAIKKGLIEIPFSPHIINANEAITIRDPEGNIRILERGKLPLSDASFAYEKSRVRLREGERVVEKIIQDIGIML
jgi:methylaspartate mutase epsilon subunit